MCVKGQLTLKKILMYRGDLFKQHFPSSDHLQMSNIFEYNMKLFTIGYDIHTI